MKKILLAAFLLFTISSAYTQQLDVAAGFANEISTAELQRHLTIIAGEEMQGRETGTEGQRKAAIYIEAQFKSIGLKAPETLKGYEQFYPLIQDSLVKGSLQIGTFSGIYGSDFIIPKTNVNGSFNSTEMVFAGYGIDDSKYSDYTSLNVKGKLVIIVLGEPKLEGKFLITGSKSSSEWTFPGLSKKISMAAEKGAAGVLVLNPMQDNFGKRMIEDSKKSSLYYPRESQDKKLPFALISTSFAKNILPNNIDSIIKKAKTGMLFNNDDKWQQNITSFFEYKKNTTTVYASNVIGIIEGSDKKDEYVFLTAHYDHLGVRDGKIYYGADDDGSGTVGVIQMAAAFAKAKAAGHGPRRTVVFMTVSGEEKGLWGSEYYSEHPVFPLEKTSVDLNTDMVGRIDTERKTADTSNYLYVVGHDKLSTELPLINEAMNNKYTGLVLDYKFDDPKDPERIYFRSDHYNFARKGVPVLFFYDGMLKADYHKPTDTVDKINWPLYEKRVRMIFHTAWEIANREEMLKRDLPIPTSTR